MKIVFCTQNMTPFRMKWMDEIAKYHDVIIYHLNEYDTDQNLKYISYVPNRAIVKCIPKKLLFGAIGYRVREIIAEKADIYLLDGYGFAGQLDLIIKLKRKRIPYLMSVDGGFIRENEPSYKRFIKSFFISKAAGYLSTSDTTDAYIDYYGGKGKTKYRHLFSNLTNEYVEDEPPLRSEKDTLKAQFGIENKFIIISVGKAQHVKGFDLLIKAIEKMKNDEFELLIIGISDSSIYTPLITDDIKNKVHFVEFCDSDKLKQYYRMSDLFILPTRGDVWGLVISEAMANGASVVTTDHCLAGVAMLEKDEIIPSENIDEICKVIKRQMSYSDKERFIIGQRNIAKARKYTIGNAAIDDIRHFEEYVTTIKD